MRRNERKIQSKEALEAIIKKCNVLRLGLSVDNMPYIVPLNYGYIDDVFYIHCAKEGKKLDMIRQNSQVCFEIDTDHELVKGEIACQYTMKYKSIIGYAQAEIIEESNDVRAYLDIVMQQFSDQSFTYGDGVVSRVAIIKLNVKEMIGKSS